MRHHTRIETRRDRREATLREVARRETGESGGPILRFEDAAERREAAVLVRYDESLPQRVDGQPLRIRGANRHVGPEKASSFVPPRVGRIDENRQTHRQARGNGRDVGPVSWDDVFEEQKDWDRQRLANCPNVVPDFRELPELRALFALETLPPPASAGQLLTGRASTNEKAIRTERTEKGFEAFEIEVKDAAHTRDVLDTMLEKRDQGRIDFPRELGDPEDLETGQQCQRHHRPSKKLRPSARGLRRERSLEIWDCGHKRSPGWTTREGPEAARAGGDRLRGLSGGGEATGSQACSQDR